MRQKSYKHYLITRFNLKQGDWNKDKNDNELVVKNDRWLKERFALFESYCFPSVQSQKCQNFIWLVYFDINTPTCYQKKIENLQKTLPNIYPRFIDGMSSLLGNIKKDILTEPGEVIITSRLDNDDMLHENFVETIQSFVVRNSIKRGVIDIPKGYCFQIYPKKVLSETIQYSNAFISLVEPHVQPQKLLTVMDKPHPQWIFAEKSYVINAERLWAQIIHDRNVINRIQGVIITDGNKLQPFGLTDVELTPRSLLETYVNILITKPAYWTKKKLKRILISFKIVFS